MLAYGAWGIVPLFWRQLVHVDALEVLAHRTVWGFVCFALLVRATGQWRRLIAALRDRRTVATMALSALLLSINWGTFVYAVATDHLLDASLGYFVNPLVSIALGRLFLRERLRRLQWAAISLATVGVGWLGWTAGRLPAIAVVLASTFGVYGLVRKKAAVDSLIGGTVETAIVTPLSLAYLAWLGLRGGGELGHADAATHGYLLATGVVTAGPLLLFTSAARRLPLATVGFLQYLAPTGQFLLAVLAFAEPLSPARLGAFAWIWAGLILFSIDLWRSVPARAAAV